MLAGCSNPGDVNDYNADTEENFLLACEEANSNLSDERVAEVCGCWYEAITENMSFEAFERAEDNIRNALDQDRLNSDDDLRREAPEFFKIIDESSCVQAGPQPS